MISLTNLKMLYDPYPVGHSTNVLPLDLYNIMVNTFPNESIFNHLSKGYNKYSLSERNNSKEYEKFVKNNWVWLSFYLYIKSPYFIKKVLGCLAVKGINFPQGETYSSRFEFSSIPANGGNIMPHTDIPSKIITLVLGMDKPRFWNKEWGGGTDILKPKDPTKLLKGYESGLDEFDKVTTFEHEPNEAVVFVKTNNSWHSVGPLCGPENTMRRTLTINIERKI